MAGSFSPEYAIVFSFTHSLKYSINGPLTLVHTRGSQKAEMSGWDGSAEQKARKGKCLKKLVLVLQMHHHLVWNSTNSQNLSNTFNCKYREHTQKSNAVLFFQVNLSLCNQKMLAWHVDTSRELPSLSGSRDNVHVTPLLVSPVSGTGYAGSDLTGAFLVSLTPLP